MPKHLESVKVSHIRQGITSEEMDVYIKEATNNPLKQLWLEQHLFPFGAPYHSKDGTLILPMATFNRRMARRLCDHLGIWDELSAKGIMDADPFVSENDEFKLKNLGKFLNLTSKSVYPEMYLVLRSIYEGCSCCSINNFRSRIIKRKID